MQTERKYMPNFTGSFNSTGMGNKSKLHHRVYSSNKSNKNSSKGFSEREISLNRSSDLKNDSDTFAQTAKKLENVSFKHHDPNLCVCNDCECGRHLCNLHGVQKPSISFSTSYKQSFTKKQIIPVSVTKANEYSKLIGPHLQMKSMYGENFPGKFTQKPEKAKGPENWLASSTGMCKLTSYSSGFPGYKCTNQYVKPNSDPAKTGLHFQGTTTYGKFFIKPQMSIIRQSSAKQPDNLGKSKGFLGDSTYRNQFKNPNPEDYNPRVRQTIEKYVNDPKHSHQFETVYKSDFLKARTTVCPAKIALESKLRGTMSNTKAKFNENSDFKGMSPQFHAISTSKFY